MRRQIARFLYAMCILFAFTCVALMIGFFIRIKDGKSISAMTNTTIIHNNYNLNQAEKTIIKKLINLDCTQPEESKQIHNRYIKYLQEYFEKEHTSLSQKKIEHISKSVDAIYAIMSKENQTDIKKLSIDGRSVAANLYEDIYRLCGLRLKHNYKGEIIKIKDTNGKVYYKKNNATEKVKFNVYALILVLLINLILIGTCIVKSKRNQLFIKNGGYHGFKEKEFV